MWFDLVLIDKLFSNGALQSAHIRAASGKPFPVDRLEDIDTEFRAADTKDVGPLRLYQHGEISTNFLESKLQNFVCEPGQIMVQLDHFGIPVTSGYYAIIFPRGWRVAELNIYDPYHKSENPAEKRSYRGVDIVWDASKSTSFAQFNMESVRRGTFSIGVIADLRPAAADVEWIDRPGQLEVRFTDTRHAGHFYEEGYRRVADEVTKASSKDDKMPGINMSLKGPSMDIVAWGRYILGKLRRPS